MISVIIPVYNSEQYLEECLNSVSNQLYKNIEIICINDGSTDNSFQVLQKYALFDHRIKIINQMNHGVSYSRNIGIQLARGKWISFVDSDDTIHPEIYIICTKYKADIIDFKYQYYHKRHKNKKSHIYFIKDPINQAINKKLIMFIWNKLFLTSAIKNHFFKEDMKIYEDWIFNFELFKNNINICHISNVLYYYRISENSLTSKNKFTKSIFFQYLKNILTKKEYDIFINNFIF